MPAFSSAPFLEINLDDLDPKEVAARFTEWGVLLLRGRPEHSERVQRIAGTPAGEGQMANSLIELTPDLALHRYVLDLLYGTLAHLFDCDTLMSMAAVSAGHRRVMPDSSIGYIPWHQDHAPVGVARMMSCWFLLDPDECGIHAPTVEFVVQRNRQPLQNHWLEGGYLQLHDMAILPGDFRWRPVIRRGDILVFDGYTPHRTFAAPSMAIPRYSADFRFAPFDARVCGSLLKHGHAPVIADRDNLFGPIERLAQNIYRFGPISGSAIRLVELFEVARRTDYTTSAVHAEPINDPM